MWNREGRKRQYPATFGKPTRDRLQPWTKETDGIGGGTFGKEPSQRYPIPGKLFQRGMESNNYGVFSQGPKYYVAPPNVWNL